MKVWVPVKFTVYYTPPLLDCPKNFTFKTRSFSFLYINHYWSECFVFYILINLDKTILDKSIFFSQKFKAKYFFCWNIIPWMIEEKFDENCVLKNIYLSSTSCPRPKEEVQSRRVHRIRQRRCVKSTKNFYSQYIISCCPIL